MWDWTRGYNTIVDVYRSVSLSGVLVEATWIWPRPIVLFMPYRRSPIRVLNQNLVEELATSRWCGDSPSKRHQDNNQIRRTLAFGYERNKSAPFLSLVFPLRKIIYCRLSQIFDCWRHSRFNQQQKQEQCDVLPLSSPITIWEVAENRMNCWATWEDSAEFHKVNVERSRSVAVWL